jgi:dTDP-4-amino-4,6-dideoxygalactose transaminase
MKSKIFYTKPSITSLEVSYATDAAINGWGDKCYNYVSRFEELFKRHLEVKYAIATSSCTGALNMGMAALGIGSGDEVILADTNWIATVSPVVHLGATPIFVDIQADSWCIDPKKVDDLSKKEIKDINISNTFYDVANFMKDKNYEEAGKAYLAAQNNYPGTIEENIRLIKSLLELKNILKYLSIL